MSVRGDIIIIGGIAVVGVIALGYLAKQGKDAGGAVADWFGKFFDKLGQGVKDAASATGDAINPVSPKNLVYRGTSAVVAPFADYNGATIGSMFADTFKPSSEKAVDAMLTTTVPRPASTRSYYDLGAKLPPVGSTYTGTEQTQFLGQ